MDQRQRRMLMYIGVGVVALVLIWGANQRSSRARAADEPTVVVVDGGQRQEMSMEEYVAGVVAGEMKEDWPKEAYAAQAILARTFALRFLEDQEGNEIPAEHEKAQAYAPENISEVIQQAVDETRGEVVTHRGELIHAWFHAYSGGETATAKEGLLFEEEEPPYIKSTKVPDNTVVEDDLKNWRAQFSPDDVRAALGELDVDVGTVEDITIEDKGPTGRVTRVKVKGSDGERTISGPDLRMALGGFEMKSMKIDRFEYDPESGLTVTGTGFGHGVGLSQWDALMLAEEGRSAEDIVRFFYNDVEIEKRW